MDGRIAVVVGVDRSPASRRAVALAIDEARRRGLPVVVLVHAWHARRHRDAALARAERLLDATAGAAESGRAGRADPPMLVERAVRGNTVPVLVEAARTAAVLVVGSHRGRVAAACARAAGCPVIAVEEGDQPCRNR